MTVTDEQLEQKEREVAEILNRQGGSSTSVQDDSVKRIERILRRIRLENRIQEEVEAIERKSNQGPESLAE